MILAMAKPDAPESAADAARRKVLNQKISDAIEDLRMEANLNQDQLAELLGMQTQRYSRYRRSIHIWTAPMLIDVALAMSVDPAVILVRAGLSAKVLDPVSAISQDDALDAKERGAFISLVRAVHERNQTRPEQ